MLNLRPTRLARLLATAAVGVACLAGLAPLAPLAPLAVASDAQPAQATPAVAAHGYLGVWNYDQPDFATMTNIAVVSCPAVTASCAGTPELELPQIGYVVFAAGPHGTVTGRTDQGCTWRFARHRGGLELSPAVQYCFNHVVGSGYTITRWSVTFSGNQESETLIATSHLPNGNYDFVLKNGRRTRAANQPGTARDFTGTWRYDRANPHTGLNIQTISYPEPDGHVKIVYAALTGPVTFTAGHRGLITARTPNGCRWTLLTSSNTAELYPARQTCYAHGSATTLTFWAIAGTRTQQVSILAGTGPRDSSFLVADGGLTRTR
jgi:hypothetical protein